MIDETAVKSARRLMSIDALRGFDMFWIIGGGLLWVQFCNVIAGAPNSALAVQMHHVEWSGLHFIDLVFPIFIFIAGLTFPFSHAKQVARGDDAWMMHRKILMRVLTLLALGVVYNGFLKSDWTKAADFRYFSVLGKIGIAWGVAALVYMHTGLKARLVVLVAGLVGYSALLCVTAPDAPAGASPTSLAGCFVGYLDRHLTPGHLYCDNLMEPSGPFVSFFGFPTTLLGMFAGDIVRSVRWTPSRRSLLLALAGLACLAVGLGCSPICPIVKKLWTPTFALVASGCGFLAFAFFHYVIDVRGWQAWSFPLRIIGMNAITIYFLSACVDFFAFALFFVESLAKACGPFEYVMHSLGVLGAKFALLYFLYRIKVFIKV